MRNDHYTGRKLDLTGVAEVEIFLEDTKICDITSMIIPSFPVNIAGFGYNLVSEFDIDSTLIPGLTRVVIDEDLGEVAFKIVYIKQGVFDINVEGRSIIVMIDENKYTFFSEGIVLAIGNKVNDAEFDMNVENDLSQKMKLAILSFPMLRFAL
ncbi:MAG: hypothetical protein IKJ85_02405 [Firmicutes bacterium]|nr:hypothetical protein [Bacillota bacterium]